MRKPRKPRYVLLPSSSDDAVDRRLMAISTAATRVCEAFADERLFTWLVMKQALRERLQGLADAVMAHQSATRAAAGRLR